MATTAATASPPIVAAVEAAPGSSAAGGRSAAGTRHDAASRHAVASQLAGAASTLALYPIDVLKNRYMAQDCTAERLHNGMRYTRMHAALRAIRDEEGVIGLFRGAHVAVGASALSWGLYMYAYRSFDHALHAVAPESAGGLAVGGGASAATSTLSIGAVAGMLAGATVNVMTNPLWLVKTRMQLARSGEERLGVIGTVRDAVSQGGVRSLWRGTSAQILAGVPSSLQYPVYEASRRAYRRAAGSTPSAGSSSSSDGSSTAASRVTSRPGPAEVFACTVMTKMVLGVVAQPTQLLRARLMDRRSRDGAVRYETLLQSLRVILKTEGVAGLYRGTVVGFAHTIPRTALQFQLYEVALALLHA